MNDRFEVHLFGKVFQVASDLPQLSLFLISGLVIVVGKSLSLRLTKASGLQLFRGTVSNSVLCVAVVLKSSLTGSASAVAKLTCSASAVAELTQSATVVVESSLLRAAFSDVSD